MTDTRDYSTPQEAFWAGEFGDDYIGRNQGDELLASNLDFFAKALRMAGRPNSCVELGANIGMNLKAIKLLHPAVSLRGVEINPQAAKQLADVIGQENVELSSIFDWQPSNPCDLSMIKGVLIHLNPERLKDAYDRLYRASSRFILIAEYYNPSPVAINYRGHQDRLFKRDFAGEMLDLYPDLALRDYGFAFHRDPAFPQDDITWFLLEKGN